MHTFNDTLGRTWTVTINVDAIRRVRALLDINLLDAIEGKLLERLVTDPVLLCDILFALVQPEAQAKNISDEDFGKSLGGDVLDHATSASQTDDHGLRGQIWNNRRETPLSASPRGSVDNGFKDEVLDSFAVTQGTVNSPTAFGFMR